MPQAQQLQTNDRKPINGSTSTWRGKLKNYLQFFHNRKFGKITEEKKNNKLHTLPPMFDIMMYPNNVKINM